MPKKGLWAEIMEMTTEGSELYAARVITRFEASCTKNGSAKSKAGHLSCLPRVALVCLLCQTPLLFPGQKLAQLPLEEHRLCAKLCCLWVHVQPKLGTVVTHSVVQRLEQNFQSGLLGFNYFLLEASMTSNHPETLQPNSHFFWLWLDWSGTKTRHT